MPGRRSSLPVRVALTALIMFGPPAVLVALRLLVFTDPADPMSRTILLPILPWACGAFLLMPAILLIRGSSPGGSDGEEGGGGGTGPLPPAPPPLGPRGGIPLPDAEPAQTRVREGHGPVFTRRRDRRPGHAPAPRRQPAHL